MRAERREGDQEPVGAISRGKPERNAEPATLRLRQRPEPAKHRRAQWCSPAKGSSISDSTPATRATLKPGRLGDRCRSSSVLPIPDSPARPGRASDRSHVAG